MNPKPKRPDVTPIQLVAVVQAVIALFIAFGLDVSPAQQKAIVDIAMVLGAALPMSDAVLRFGRNLGARG